VLRAVNAANEAMARQMEAERQARAAMEAQWISRVEQASEGRLAAERLRAEALARLEAAEAMLAAERVARERLETRSTPAPPASLPLRLEPADYKLKIVRGADGKISDVLMNRVPKKGL